VYGTQWQHKLPALLTASGNETPI